ncbi:25.3 kDa vesicle transport protein [Dioscorea cayenensis subsp. rotundata]|uniref:25.3 kDa vesicle transport protein n=1 Tax=Dioscorea cayennensis subsp. rotundata TaxID=55577 RepID=A0AB40C3P3_DIOCR|nr:25.3 kDa vesicle transport protein [Dioscorea cayenensis subsp. rotundata]
MVKLTLIGRLSDGLPLTQTPEYLNEDIESTSEYKDKGELVLVEVSRRGALESSGMTVLIDHHCFHCLISNSVCYLTLCDVQYPTKLAFHYLQDLRKEFEKVELKIVEAFSKPYAFKKFEYVVGSIRKQYVDTRTQANLSKMKSNRVQDLSIVTEDFSEFINRVQAPVVDMLRTESGDWNTKVFQEIALKWTPIVICFVAVFVVFWSSIVITEYRLIAT